MLIKGTGSDMKVAQPKDFPAVRLEEIRASFDREDMTDEEMVAYFARCMVDPAAPRPSIETLLHGYLEGAAVAHSHADAILSLTNTRAGEEMVSEVYGDDVAIVGYRRPGFRLAKEVALAVKASPPAQGVVLMNHGLITWGDTAEEAYERHIALVTRAEDFVGSSHAPRRFDPAAHAGLPEVTRHAVAARVAPMLARDGQRADPQDSPLRRRTANVLEFADLERAAALAGVGAATPDHMLNTKRAQS